MISANGGLPAHRYTPQVTQRWPRGSEPASALMCVVRCWSVVVWAGSVLCCLPLWCASLCCVVWFFLLQCFYCSLPCLLFWRGVLRCGAVVPCGTACGVCWAVLPLLCLLACLVRCCVVLCWCVCVVLACGVFCCPLVASWCPVLLPVFPCRCLLVWAVSVRVCCPLWSFGGVCCRWSPCLVAWPAAPLCAVVRHSALLPCAVSCGAVCPCGAVLWSPAVFFVSLAVLICPCCLLFLLQNPEKMVFRL